MTSYLFWWIGGGLVGMAAALGVLRFRGVLTWKASCVLAAAGCGVLYGAKLQFRLSYLPPMDAMLIPPGELITRGYHIPLGLVCGFVTGMLACAIVHAPWLHLADALAMAGAAMMPIARIGCLVSGCCTGPVCPSWMAMFCRRYPPGSEAFYAQLANGSIAPDAVLSLPVHPLPLYFGMLGLSIALLFVWLLRVDVRPGTLAAVGFVLYPLGQLMLEPLRVSVLTRQSLVMTTVLASMTAVGLAAIVWMASRPLSAAPWDPGRRLRRSP